MVKQKICIKKTNTFTINAMTFVQEQLRTEFRRAKKVTNNGQNGSSLSLINKEDFSVTEEQPQGKSALLISFTSSFLT